MLDHFIGLVRSLFRILLFIIFCSPALLFAEDEESWQDGLDLTPEAREQLKRQTEMLIEELGRTPYPDDSSEERFERGLILKMPDPDFTEPSPPPKSDSLWHEFLASVVNNPHLSVSARHDRWFESYLEDFNGTDYASTIIVIASVDVTRSLKISGEFRQEDITRQGVTIEHGGDVKMSQRVRAAQVSLSNIYIPFLKKRIPVAIVAGKGETSFGMDNTYLPNRHNDLMDRMNRFDEVLMTKVVLDIPLETLFNQKNPVRIEYSYQESCPGDFDGCDGRGYAGKISWRSNGGAGPNSGVKIQLSILDHEGESPPSVNKGLSFSLEKEINGVIYYGNGVKFDRPELDDVDLSVSLGAFWREKKVGFQYDMLGNRKGESFFKKDTAFSKVTVYKRWCLIENCQINAYVVGGVIEFGEKSVWADKKWGHIFDSGIEARF